MSGDQELSRHLVGRLSGMARQMEMTARADLGTGCGFALTPDGTFRVRDGMGHRSRLELAFPRMWHTEIPDYLRRAVIETPFAGRDFLGKPIACGRCGQNTPGGLVMVYEESHPLCNACAGRVAPFLRTVCEAGLALARSRTDAENPPAAETTQVLAEALQSLRDLQRAIANLMGALPEPAFAPGTDAPLNRSAQLYALLTTMLQDNIEPALSAVRQAEDLGEMLEEGR